jgi:hypothetical protein
MNIDTGHIIHLAKGSPVPERYVALTPDEVALLPRQARRRLERSGEASLPEGHSLLAKVRRRATT